jgi:hypothetical protein
MARAGGMRHWAALKRTLVIPDNPNLKPLAKPTDETLDRYEAETGFRLPRSYCSFIKVFGPGVLAWDYRIVAPGYPEQGWAVDLAAFNAECHRPLADKRVLRQFKDPAQVRRVVFFCRPGDGDLVGWDPEDVRDKQWHEYGIYEWGREEALGFVAASFTEFIEDVCLSAASLRLAPKQVAELGTRREFLPEYDLKGQ